MNESDKKITVLAVGGAGCRVAAALRENPLASPLKLLAADTNAASLEESGLPEDARLLVGARWRGGRGCGGSALDGQRAFAQERTRLEELLNGTRLLLVCGGLGGGSASGGMPIVLSVARKLEIPTVFLVTTPFSMEGGGKRRIAEDVIREELVPMAEAVIVLPNDLLFSLLPSDVRLEDAFRMADEQLSRTLLAFSSILLQGNLLSTTLEDFVTLLKRKKSYCSIGVGWAAGVAPARGETALDMLLKSPLLGGENKMKDADAVVLSLVAGPGLTIGETRTLLEKLSLKTAPDAKLIVGAATSDAWGDFLQLCVLTIKFDEQPLNLPAGAAAKTVRRRNSVKSSAGLAPGEEKTPQVEQRTFDFDEVSKGIMEKTTPVIFNGDDLDIPTFKRKNLTVDNGKR